MSDVSLIARCSSSKLCRSIPDRQPLTESSCVLPLRSIVEMVRTGARVIRPLGAVGLQRQHSGGSVEQARAPSATGSGASITERVVSELRHAGSRLTLKPNAKPYPFRHGGTSTLKPAALGQQLRL